MSDNLFIAQHGTQTLSMLPRMANRHGLVAGATGTGKTVTLQRLAEEFSRLGVPVFLADVKGDLAGLCQPGTATPPIARRLEQLGRTDHPFAANPTVFWDVYGVNGHPVRATISEMGPLLLSRLLNLNDTQSGILTIAFKLADDQGLLLLDLKDLQAMVRHVGENAKELTLQYGNVSAASVGAIQRALLRLEQAGATTFFGEPALDLMDFIQTAPDGRGVINVLAAETLVHSPQLYSTFLLWLMAELFERLPEVGDLAKPKLVFFFDEAHLLFDDAPKELLDKVEQVVRLIRSKGVGIYFVTQNPRDVPDKVLGQLGNRVQHALRAFTPRDQAAVRTAAETFRPNPALDTAHAITELAVGEALVSFLDEKGAPSIVERAFVIPPSGRLGPITPEERKAVLASSVIAGHYENAIDRESAYEILTGRAQAAAEQAAGQTQAAPKEKASPSRRTDSVLEAFGKSAARAAGSSAGRSIIRGLFDTIFGGLFGKKKR
ncbi:MAG: DUF853 domain-containing protein [Bacteroidales bacterium]|nr:DUF853 domain-containing protein [Bacteroidales bacterium]